MIPDNTPLPVGLGPTRSELLNLLESCEPSRDLLKIMAWAACSWLNAEHNSGAKQPSQVVSQLVRPFTCGIINAKSGLCGEDCSFCAQSRHHSASVPVYPLMKPRAILAKAEQLADQGVYYLGLVISGGTPNQNDFEKICEAALEIRNRFKIKLCASLGLISPDRARNLKQAGFTSYHHNLETAPGFYSRVCGTHSIERRLETVKNARRAGLRVCSGGIFGLGESWTQRLELAELLGSLEVDSIPINFLTPIAGTPLERARPLTPIEALLIIALFRISNPSRDIVICGGRGLVLGEWDRLVFSAGANGLMVGDYLTTKGRALERDLNLLSDLGLRPSFF